MTEHRQHGVLVRWLDDRHFGFLRPDSSDRDVFIGDSAFRAADIVPEQGARYTFLVDADREGRPRATDLAYEGAEKAARQVFNPIRP